MKKLMKATNCVSRIRIHIEMERTRDMSLGYRERQPSPQLDRYGVMVVKVCACGAVGGWE